MQRWHLTLGLTVLALGAVTIAPRLVAQLQGAVDPEPEPEPPVVDLVIDVAPNPVELPPVEPLTIVDTAPVSTGHLVVSAGLDKTAVLQGSGNERFLTINVSAPADIGNAVRRPVDLAVVLDASGSMSARGKIDYAKRAAKLLASSMEANDVYTLVVFNDDATTVVPATRVSDVKAIHRAIDRVYEGGGTNLYAGMSRAADEVTRTLTDAHVGRVVILSDGNANVGVTDPAALSRFAAGLSGKGLTVSTVGLGLDYNEDLLARMSDVGGGTYDFVDDPRELETVFADELSRSASVVARGTTLRVDLPEGVAPVEVIGWDVSKTSTGWQIYMGDVYAGQTRKIVTRVRVIGDRANDTMAVANVAADYRDLIDDIAATTYAQATASVTTDTTIVDASIDRDRAVEANRAWGNWYLDKSSRAYADGNVREASRLARAGEDVLVEASQALSAGQLATEAADLREARGVYQSYAPSSASGKRAIKKGKEMFRGRSR